MKRIKYINWLLFIGIIFATPVFLSAQDEDTNARARQSERAKMEEDKRKDMVAEMELQQEMMRQKLVQMEYKQQEEEMARQMELQAKQAEIAAKEMEYRARAMSFGDQNTSQLMLSKTYHGDLQTDNTGEFSVEESVKNIKINVEGAVKSGQIVVTLILPDGKKFKELTFDETADIRYSQSLNIVEEQNNYKGNWKYRIKVDKAEGSYRMSISTH